MGKLNCKEKSDTNICTKIQFQAKSIKDFFYCFQIQRVKLRFQFLILEIIRFVPKAADFTGIRDPSSPPPRPKQQTESIEGSKLREGLGNVPTFCILNPAVISLLYLEGTLPQFYMIFLFVANVVIILRRI